MSKFLLYLILFLSLLIAGFSCSEKGSRVQDNQLRQIERLWQYNNPKESESRFHAFLDSLKSSSDKYDHDFAAEILTQIARAQGLQGKFKQGLESIYKAESEIKSTSGRGWVRILMEKGRLYNSSGNGDKALPLFLEAWQLASQKRFDYLAIDAAHMLGIVSEPSQQNEWNLKALALAESSTMSEAKNWLGPLYNNIGWSYHDNGEYEKALEFFEKGESWRKQMGESESLRIARWTVGRTLRSLDKIDEALAVQLNLEAEIDSSGANPDGYVYEELGEIYLLKGKPDKAAEYFSKAYELLSQDEWLRANQPERLERLKSLSDQ